jgi:hypothetical protein
VPTESQDQSLDAFGGGGPVQGGATDQGGGAVAHAGGQAGDELDDPGAEAIAGQAEDDIEGVKAWAFGFLGDEVSAGVGDFTEAGVEGAFGVLVFEAIAAVLEPGLEIEAVVAANEEEGEQETTEGGDEGEETLLEGEEGGGLSGLVGAGADGRVEGEVELLDNGQRSIWQAVAGVGKLKRHGAYSEPGLREQTSVRICPVCLVDREWREYCPDKGRERARVPRSRTRSLSRMRSYGTTGFGLKPVAPISYSVEREV